VKLVDLSHDFFDRSLAAIENGTDLDRSGSYGAQDNLPRVILFSAGESPLFLAAGLRLNGVSDRGGLRTGTLGLSLFLEDDYGDGQDRYNSNGSNVVFHIFGFVV
jgi:hypothetical protein